MAPRPDPWEQKDIDVLVQMRNTGSNMKEIAEALGKTHSSVKMYVQRHSEELGLRPALDFKKPAKAQCRSFEKQWQGSVPFGHWSITKPWRRSI